MLMNIPNSCKVFPFLWMGIYIVQVGNSIMQALRKGMASFKSLPMPN